MNRLNIKDIEAILDLLTFNERYRKSKRAQQLLDNLEEANEIEKLKEHDDEISD